MLYINAERERRSPAVYASENMKNSLTSMLKDLPECYETIAVTEIYSGLFLCTRRPLS